MSEKKMYWRTPLSDHKTITTPSGEKLEDVWEMKLDEKGNEIFYVSGQTNVYEKTQAYQEECQIENILARCLETGDMSALEKIQGNYMDISEMPTSMIEAQNKIKEAEKNFNDLPLEIRTKFDNNFNKYLAEFGSESWLKKMEFVKEETKEEKPAEKETVKETKADE